MAHFFDYALIQLIPYAHRGERLNVGIVVFKDNSIDVRINTSSTILNYFNVSTRSLDWVVDRIKESDDVKLKSSDRFLLQSQFSAYQLSEMGWFSAETEYQYENRIGDILKEYVEQPKIKKFGKKSSVIAGQLRSMFKEHDVFSRNISDLEKHKVIQNVPVGPSGRLTVDFLLKNSKYHATETFDIKESDHVGVADIKNAALINVTFSYAKHALSHSNVACYLVYSASLVVEKTAEPALVIAKRDASDIFNLESREDKNRYLDTMLNAAGVNGLFL
jgi:Protein of unknown function (DUF3037)